VTGAARSRRAEGTPGAARALLVVAPAGGEGDDLLQDLRARGGFRVLRVSSADEAAAALRERDVCLLIAAPDVPTSAVSDLLASKERLRPEVPVLVIRNRQAEEPVSWTQRGVGVLRCPLLPEALSRSVDVVLGLELHPS
jgi:DNA-binding NtrC family response regulator